jgi:site-specific recombinase XerD
MADSMVARADSGLLFRADQFPKIISDAGQDAMRRFAEFFTANIRNKNTREAYARAVAQFCRWCERRGFALELLEPVVIAAYIEELGQRLAKPTVKQHLAAIRVLFDYLVVGQIVPINPAASVRGPKYVVNAGSLPCCQRKIRANFSTASTRQL